MGGIKCSMLKNSVKKTIEAFMMEHDLFPVLRQLLRIQRNPWEVFKRNRKFLCELQVLRDEHVLGGLSQPDSHFLFSFCRDLAFLAMKSPKEKTLPRPKCIAQCGSGLWVRAGAKSGSIQTPLTVPALLLLLHESYSRATNAFRSEEASPPGVLASLSALAWTAV